MAKLIFDPDDLMNACSSLKAKNKFSPGFDKMTPGAAETWLKINAAFLCRQLNRGKYRFMPATGFSTAKIGGSYRRLAKLTAIDSIIQIAALNKLEAFCEGKFSKNSFAYIKGRGMGNALKEYCILAGKYPFASKTDPKFCFDNINHQVLEAALNKFFFDKRTVGLLMDCAKMPVIIEGELTERSKGIIQGAPVSGMLCNIYLHSLDLALRDAGIPFLRYADDVVTFAENSSRANNNFNFVKSFFESKLRLKINNSKSQVDRVEKLKYLGSSFCKNADGSVSINLPGNSAAVYYEWNKNKPLSHRNSTDILSDGILRQKDFSAIFESSTSKTVIPLEATDRINIFSSVIFDNGFLEKAMQNGVYINVFKRDYSFLGRFTPFAPLKDQRLIFNQLMAYSVEL